MFFTPTRVYPTRGTFDRGLIEAGRAESFYYAEQKDAAAAESQSAELITNSDAASNAGA